jgi:nucleotide-binding universal stress UspA family protein
MDRHMSTTPYLFNRVLIACDGAPDSTDMVRYALETIDQPLQLTIVSLSRCSVPAAACAPARLHDALHGFAGLHPSLRVLSPGEQVDPARTILETAREMHSNIIIMAIQKHTAPCACGAQTVSEQVALRSDIPVMVLRPESLDRSPRRMAPARIVVPLDGSVVSRQALPVAGALAARFGIPMHLLTVIDPVTALPPAYAYLPGNDPERRDAIASLQYNANQILNQVEAELRCTSLQVDSELVYGPIRKCLTGATREGDLVVMTTHGQGNATRSRLGSVALHAIREASVPVIVLHTPAVGPSGEFEGLWGQAAYIPLRESTAAR